MRYLLIALVAVVAGCSTGGGGHPTLMVYGDMQEPELRYWLQTAANCAGGSPQAWGEFYTVLHPGKKFDYRWDDQVLKGVGGITHFQPDGSVHLHFVNDDRVKAHEARHVNRIKCCNDYSEPFHPWNWCSLVARFAGEEDPAPVVTIGPDGRIR